jgi:hypothetical protein
MTQKTKQYPVARLFENIVSIGLMLGGLPFVISGDTYVAALMAIGAGMLLSTSLILIRFNVNRAQKKLSIFAKAAFICWGFVILTFLITTINSSYLDGLSLWARTSIFVGPIGMILASIALFVTGRPQTLISS